MEATRQLTMSVGVEPACRAVGFPRATFYRLHAPEQPRADSTHARPKSHRALSEQEEQAVLDLLHEERFVDRAPHEVWATVLDEGVYLCSTRTMYRILDRNQEVKERRNQVRHVHYAKPELLATAPNQVWSWDITKLKGPVKGSCFHLYTILDIFSRCVLGWMVAERETAVLAERLIRDTLKKQGVARDQLTLHADRGSSMKSKPVAMLLADLGVNKTHGRPHVSNDNPYSEAQFKTLKYRPDFPDRFGSIQDARMFCRSFFRWYNAEHRHTGIALLTPLTVHCGGAQQAIAHRQQVLQNAYAAHPERFVRRPPTPPVLPPAVWINPPPSRDNGDRGTQ